jgi:hypothetical protein
VDRAWIRRVRPDTLHTFTHTHTPVLVDASLQVTQHEPPTAGVVAEVRECLHHLGPGRAVHGVPACVCMWHVCVCMWHVGVGVCMWHVGVCMWHVCVCAVNANALYIYAYECVCEHGVCMCVVRV